jgi:hypothetical protein
MMSPTMLVPARSRRRKVGDRPTVDPRLAAQYESAMFVVGALAEQLAAAQRAGVAAPLRRGLHARLDYELMRAITAARAVHDQLFEAAGGQHHAETDDDVAQWKRRLNEALTLRSKHQLATMDDAGVTAPAAAAMRSRAAFGPHQAGMDFAG